MALDLSSTTTRLIKKLGDETYVSITRKSGGTFDPVEGTTTGEASSVLPAVGAVTKVDSRVVDGTRIKATDKMIILDKEITPLYTDLISFGGVDHTVVDIDEVNHAGVTQLWKVICRG